MHVKELKYYNFSFQKDAGCVIKIELFFTFATSTLVANLKSFESIYSLLRNRNKTCASKFISSHEHSTTSIVQQM